MTAEFLCYWCGRRRSSEVRAYRGFTVETSGGTRWHWRDVPWDECECGRGRPVVLSYTQTVVFLTVRQRQALEDLLAGLTVRQVAVREYVTDKTVKHHRGLLYRKLRLPENLGTYPNRLGMIRARAEELGLV